MNPPSSSSQLHIDPVLCTGAKHGSEDLKICSFPAPGD